MQTIVAIAYHTGYGHTGRLAEAVAKGASEVPGTTVEQHAVDQLTEDDWQALDRADAIIFGCPTYMSSASAAFATFKEATSKVWADNMRWRDKIAAGFTNSGNMSGDKLNTLVQIALLASQHGMVWVGLDRYGGWNTSAGAPSDTNRLGSWLGAMSQSNNDEGPDTAPIGSDLETAAALGRRVARFTKLHRAGDTYLSGTEDGSRDAVLSGSGTGECAG
ncbi:multimeric flavodoxin WrbA [Lipingzhangella halophila]|uniref:Multimeric flavodoxin WrbA n=1 Tax=Lipingzhangella halophila TaxID=1783352 RepID=A0A7W7W3Y9_9ACTN|nr:flavodoxin family protein [Lipingzhangella halophila]MBB4933043.1 multimeric flavodoxin WrbA [Lipingzhangella halophila]